MKILFIDTYYPRVLGNFQKLHGGFSKYSYKVYKRKLLDTFFGTSDFYSHALRQLGHKADEIIVNDEILQKKWAKENNMKFKTSRLLSRLQGLPYLYKFFGRPQWIQEIALAQLCQYKPDVVYVQNLSILNVDTLNQIRKECKLLVGQIASPLPGKKYIDKFDLIITSFPHFVKRIKKLGINCEYQTLAFENHALKKVGKQKRTYDVTFVGSFSPYHLEGTRLLEKLAAQIPVHVWGSGLEFLSPFSPLRKNYHGEAWGLDMYKIFAKSKIVVNRHISVAENNANNMRMFEATGMGALLITDFKKNLNDIFKIGEEVVAYMDADDLVSKAKYYLEAPNERERIAKAGQNKTLHKYDYLTQMKELIKILEKYLK